MANLLKEKYAEISGPLAKEIGVKNKMEVPRIVKVTVNTGLSSKKDAKFIEVLESTLTKIAGQKPVVTKARKSIAGFKVREGMPLGAMVTLRGKRMWDFLDKLVHVTYPRVRDFRGVDISSVDASGNLNLGIKEHIAFPEVESDAIDQLHGLQVTVTTTADSREAGIALFKALGFPFKK